MADRISKVFAVSGDKTSVPEDSTSTELSFDQGWSSAYELEQGTAGARDISRPQHNYLWSVVTGNIKQWQEQAFPEFYSDIAYSVGSVVRYTDDENYICHTEQSAGTLPTDHSAFINLKFYGSYAYAVSQLANGSASLVGFIYEGQTVDAFDYLIYPSDGRIYERGLVTGTTTGAFNPTDGSATGLSGDLTQVNGVTKREVDLYKQSVTVNFASDEDVTLTDEQNLHGRIVLTDTGGDLTDERELVVSDDERFLTVKNETDYAIKVVTASGTGVHVEVGEQFSLRVEDGDVVSNGVNNSINILDDGSYGNAYVGTYPRGLTQDDLHTIHWAGAIPTEQSDKRDESKLDAYYKKESPTSWIVRLVMATSSINSELRINYASATTWDISNVTNAIVKYAYAYLEDGVTY